MIFRLTFFALALAVSAAVAPSADNAPTPSLDQLLKTQADGNQKDAYEGLRRFVLDKKDASSPDLVKAFNAAMICLPALNRSDEIDEFREKVVAAHKKDWLVQMAVAHSYLTFDHYGFMIAGEFSRGQHRGGGKVVHATARDRVRALQLYLSAMKIAQNENDKAGAAELLRQFAQAITYGRQPWQLQSLTNLDKLPDYEEGWSSPFGQQGAPVNEAGEPVFYSVPKSWDDAKSDGERWRWLLATMVEWQPSRRNDERLERARMLESQFGVQTMAQSGYFFPMPREASGKNSTDLQTGIWALETLGDDETIARLATGIKRFKLPDEHNYIKLYQQILSDTDAATKQPNDLPLEAARSLAFIFENRRQYPRAVEYWRQVIDRSTGDPRKMWERRLQQIVGNWGQFENVMSQPAGRGATVDFRFRNAKQVEFVAQEIDVRKLLDDVKAYLKSKPKQLQWEQMNVSDIGYRLVQEDQKKYIGAEVARWKLDIEPREKHFDKRITVATPLQKSGAYFVTAKVADGNTSQIILWLADTAIARKPMADKSFYYVADAVTGAPIEKANVEFFAYRQRWQQLPGRHQELRRADRL